MKDKDLIGRRVIFMLIALIIIGGVLTVVAGAVGAI